MKTYERVAGATLAVILLWSTSAIALDPAPRCESGKLKESSRYAACRLKAEAKAVAKGVVPDYSKCEAKFADRWDRIEQKAGPGMCPSEGDQVSMDARITLDAAEVATLLSGGTLPECGDGIVNSDEQCDGANVPTTCAALGYTAGGSLGCSTGCTFDVIGCGCPTCGNGAIDPGEQCDGTNVPATCADLGYLGGWLGCTAACGFNTGGCLASAACPAACSDALIAFVSHNPSPLDHEIDVQCASASRSIYFYAFNDPGRAGDPHIDAVLLDPSVCQVQVLIGSGAALDVTVPLVGDQYLACAQLADPAIEGISGENCDWE